MTIRHDRFDSLGWVTAEKNEEERIHRELEEERLENEDKKKTDDREVENLRRAENELVELTGSAGSSRPRRGSLPPQALRAVLPALRFGHLAAGSASSAADDDHSADNEGGRVRSHSLSNSSTSSETSTNSSNGSNGQSTRPSTPLRSLSERSPLTPKVEVQGGGDGGGSLWGRMRGLVSAGVKESGDKKQQPATIDEEGVLDANGVEGVAVDHWYRDSGRGAHAALSNGLPSSSSSSSSLDRGSGRGAHAALSNGFSSSSSSSSGQIFNQDGAGSVGNGGASGGVDSCVSAKKCAGACCKLVAWVCALALLGFGSFLVYKLGVVPYFENLEPVSIILTADPGTLIGLSERSLLEQHMTELEDEVEGAGLCDRVWHGRLLGHRVLLVTTGIGHDRAAVCFSGLLNSWYSLTKEVIFLGTSGFSPARGGILDSDSCGGASPAATTELTAIGDVCVSHFATNWDCQKCVYPDTVDSACVAAGCSMHSRDDLFGQFEEGYVGSPDLSNEVVAAMRGVQLATQPPLLQSYTERYWRAMSEGTGEGYAATARTRPKAWDYRSCGEASSDSFWVGAPYDELARGYIAKQIDEALKLAESSPSGHDGDTPGQADDDGQYVHTLKEDPLLKDPPQKDPPPSPQTPPRLTPAAERTTKRDTIAVSAMEGVGWMSVLYNGDRKLGYKRIPAVNVRGAADHVHPPLRRKRIRVVVEEEEGVEVDEEGSGGALLRPRNATTTSKLVWKNDESWVSPAELSEFVTLGYRFSINTTSTVVLTLFRARNQALAAAQAAYAPAAVPRESAASPLLSVVSSSTELLEGGSGGGDQTNHKDGEDGKDSSPSSSQKKRSKRVQRETTAVGDGGGVGVPSALLTTASTAVSDRAVATPSHVSVVAAYSRGALAAIVEAATAAASRLG
eukprot:CAMPEP_0171984592 /NCGR_PEP_ID=MMETSP0993-20121228/273905_1 /TAXON_ID=483369 /ORGANISM="non described non described, Strain CCMP2098" /LENGTH=906 /DNA_ID=CAMNT_0012637415 /DNA_START=115 /DNA_END=2833 /DNA_ORIENTATION=-